MRHNWRCLGVAWCLVLCVGVAHADNSAELMASYRAALQQENMVALGALIAPAAQIRVTLQQGQEQMTFTLTRAEFLQQQAALWNFSEQSNFTFSQVQSKGDALSFKQQSRYALFHQDYRLESDISATITHVNGTPQLSTISTLTEEK